MLRERPPEREYVAYIQPGGRYIASPGFVIVNSPPSRWLARSMNRQADEAELV